MHSRDHAHRVHHGRLPGAGRREAEAELQRPQHRRRQSEFAVDLAGGKGENLTSEADVKNIRSSGLLYARLGLCPSHLLSVAVFLSFSLFSLVVSPPLSRLPSPSPSLYSLLSFLLLFLGCHLLILFLFILSCHFSSFFLNCHLLILFLFILSCHFSSSISVAILSFSSTFLSFSSLSRLPSLYPSPSFILSCHFSLFFSVAFLSFSTLFSLVISLPLSQLPSPPLTLFSSLCSSFSSPPHLPSLVSPLYSYLFSLIISLLFLHLLPSGAIYFFFVSCLSSFCIDLSFSSPLSLCVLFSFSSSSTHLPSASIPLLLSFEAFSSYSSLFFFLPPFPFVLSLLNPPLSLLYSFFSSLFSFVSLFCPFSLLLCLLSLSSSLLSLSSSSLLSSLFFLVFLSSSFVFLFLLLSSLFFLVFSLLLFLLSLFFLSLFLSSLFFSLSSPLLLY
ncbi:hypothetical protein C7M84_011591 [Penaeus vannamei]|uniref:Uncharacterized protein n=1 Tax=Penaeus vannamei TaxID=6689 RepID=A0A423T110_PENVA|nr:hypothetical protein C7M84_011591 [Penaeus vannamei]